MGNKTDKISGQAIVEYILLLAIILSFAVALKVAVTKSRDKIWKEMICEVSAPCATCKSTDSAQAMLKTSGAKCKN